MGVNKTDNSFTEKKRYLIRYKNIMARVARLENNLFEIDSKLTTVQGQIITDMPKGGQPTGLDDLLIQKEELQERINRLVTKAHKERRNICIVIDKLDDPIQADVMERYFIGCLILEDIAEEMGYSLSGIKKIYHAGMRNVQVKPLDESI